jgi:hypothetical protein
MTPQRDRFDRLTFFYSEQCSSTKTTVLTLSKKNKGCRIGDNPQTVASAHQSARFADFSQSPRRTI